MSARLTREDWLDLGLRQLAQGGAEAVKLAPVCKAAGVTRGSFYHHFDDHDAFLQAMARHWVLTHTEGLVARFPAAASAGEKERLLTEMAMQVDFHVELGIREVARRNGAVAAIVAAADARRLQVLTMLYAERFGIDQDRARMAAKLEYAAYVGALLIQSDIGAVEQRAMADTVSAMMAAYFRADGRD
ncbi:TetR/AcrR family transcriptional regulator [Roseicyclus mahoneyensis]|uniref:TetR family transcriptional regulator n=1 Tax=Roseicyclus mahoneyensis TaxID=164332 RepID=A0A316GGE5_9RHOB|nr:TetR/AcrR family transcriptional regulator [Roseicyclus mahoneyensis]PWK60062.1 TetR family transcriptional regulator [Roseicyclus mahoneyensis]